MSKTAVKLRVPYPDQADAGDALQIYTDFGSGTVDTGKPLLATPLQLFPGRKKRFEGIGTEVIGVNAVGGLASPPLRSGIGNEIIGQTPVGAGEPFLDVVVLIPPGFGKYKFAAELVDENGNKQAAALPEVQAMVSSIDPPTVKSFSFGSYDGVTDTVTLDFTKNTE